MWATGPQPSKNKYLDAWATIDLFMLKLSQVERRCQGASSGQSSCFFGDITYIELFDLFVYITLHPVICHTY